MTNEQKLVPKPVRVRLAPSPTGPFHIGTARTALFNWLFARQNSGKFILRIEDTDKERSKKNWEKEIVDGLEWLGFIWDEFYRQSERAEIYKTYLEKLISEGKAYYCYCTKEELEAERQAMLAQGLPPKYGGHCRDLTAPPPGKKPQVIRFKTPEAEVVFKDIIRGTVKFDASLFGDMVIAKNTISPLYNFAAVVDDEEMRISHVIRGEDHLSNTPKQILLAKAMGFGNVEYAHLPLILAPDKSKLSKRAIETSFSEYKEKYLPEAIVNFLALLGWHPKRDQEVLGKNELVKEFDLKRVQKAGAIFDLNKLNWLQKEHLRLLGDGKITELLLASLKKIGFSPNKTMVGKIVKTQRERITNLEVFSRDISFFFQLIDYDPKLLVWQKSSPEKTATVLEKTYEIAAGAKSQKNFIEEIKLFADQEGRGAVLWPLRVALSGLQSSPDPLEISVILDTKEIKKRLEVAIRKIKNLTSV